jgi:hypothetical protein
VGAPDVLSPEVKRPEREADHSSPSSAGVKIERSYTSTPPIRLYSMMLNYSMATSSWCGNSLSPGQAQFNSLLYHYSGTTVLVYALSQVNVYLITGFKLTGSQFSCNEFLP